MKKIKLISAEGTDQFTSELETWLDENQAVNIISISHSAHSSSVATTPTETLHIYNLSALIVYETILAAKQ